MSDEPLEISCSDTASLRAAGAALTMLDCREPEEHQIVSIAAAKLLPMSQLADRVAELAPLRRERIVVFCHHGGRSKRVATWLRRQGFEAAQSLSGGIDQWALEIDTSLPRY